MARKQSASKLPARQAIMRLPFENILEGFPKGATAIGPDTRLRYLNSHLAKSVGPWAGKTCYQALAGLDTFCPFCPFEKLVAGSAGPEINVIQVGATRKIVLDRGGCGEVRSTIG